MAPNPLVFFGYYCYGLPVGSGRMANDSTLLSAILCCVVSVMVAQTTYILFADFIVLMTSIAYHGFDRRHGSGIHKIDMCAVGTALTIHIVSIPQKYFLNVGMHYILALFCFGMSHASGNKRWYLTSCGHLLGAYANYNLSAAMSAAITQLP
ncbi:hypothetical protein AAMO2058_000436500 [Amorphochlora amoebiformis]